MKSNVNNIVSPVIHTYEVNKGSSFPLLSVLICTVKGREDRLSELLKTLFSMADAVEQHLEIITAYDNKEISVGEKRQILLEEAKGKYVAFIDDDDLPGERYFERICPYLLDEPDALGMWIECQGTEYNLGRSANDYSDWEEPDHTGDNYYHRTIYHKSPVKRELALSAGFQDKRFAEDVDFSRRLKPLLNVVPVVPLPPLYVYRYEAENPKTKYGL